MDLVRSGPVPGPEGAVGQVEEEQRSGEDGEAGPEFFGSGDGDERGGCGGEEAEEEKDRRAPWSDNARPDGGEDVKPGRVVADGDLGIGCCALDMIVEVPRYPAPDQKTRAANLRLQGGGLTATALVAVCRLGGSAAWIGALSPKGARIEATT